MRPLSEARGNNLRMVSVGDTLYYNTFLCENIGGEGYICKITVYE